MTRQEKFRTGKFGKASAAEIFRQRMDSLPWPEFRFLAAYALGEQMPSLSFWMDAVREEATGPGCDEEDAA